MFDSQIPGGTGSNRKGLAFAAAAAAGIVCVLMLTFLKCGGIFFILPWIIMTAIYKAIMRTENKSGR